MDLANARIAQLMIPVKSIERGTAFYKDVLGLPFLFPAPPQMSFFDCGGVRLLIAVPTPGQAAQRGSTIYFGVPNIKAVHAALRAKGVAFMAEPHVVHRTPQYELWLAEFKDPDGNQLALMCEAPVASPDVTGA